MKCKCEEYGLLRKLLIQAENSEGDSEEWDVYYSKIEELCALDDPYAAYLRATTVFEEELFTGQSDDVDTFNAVYLRKMKGLAHELNPWALGDLGCYYMFDDPGAHGENKALGRYYTFLGALFGDPKSMFYHGYQLRGDPKLQALSKRLMKASAEQKFHRAEAYLLEDKE